MGIYSMVSYLSQMHRIERADRMSLLYYVLASILIAVVCSGAGRFHFHSNI